MKSRKGKKNSNQTRLLSTNNKNFTSRDVSRSSYQNSNHIDHNISPFIKDEDVRHEKVHDSKFILQKAYDYHQRNDIVITAILEESLNGYNVTAKAPFETNAAIKHYTKMLRRFTLDFPEEWALCHYSLGKIFTSDRSSSERSKCIENGLFHFKTCSQIFTVESFPTMSAIISLFQASLSRERSLLILNREYNQSASRATAITSTESGIEFAESALSFFTREPHRFQLEQGFTRFEIGWLFYLAAELKSDVISPQEYTQQLEISVTHFEKALSIFERLEADKTFKIESQSPNKPTRNYEANSDSEENDSQEEDDDAKEDGDDQESPKQKSNWFNLPAIGKAKDGKSVDGKSTRSGRNGSDIGAPYNPHHHLRVLLAKKTLNHYVGKCFSLLGQVYYGISTEGDSATRKETFHMTYEYLTAAINPKYQLKESIDWISNRLLIANVVTKEPSVLHNDSSDSHVNQDIAIDVALSHLNLALVSPLAKKRLPEIFFSLAQITFSKLHFLSNKIVSPLGFTKPLPDGTMPMEVLKESERYYLEAIQLVTKMSKQGLHAYIYYYSSLKMVELKILQAITRNITQHINNSSGSSATTSTPINDLITKPSPDRDDYFQISLKYLLTALHARKPFENTDLHLLCSSQLGYLLSIGPKRELSIHCFVRSILCLSCLILRSRFLQLSSSINQHYPPSSSSYYEINNLGVKKLVTHESTSGKRGSTSPEFSSRRSHVSNQQLVDEAKRLTSLAILSSLKLVQWMKPVYRGVAQTTGYGSWCFEEFATLATRLEALTGESKFPTKSDKATIISGEKETILIKTKSGIIKRTPSRPLDNPPLSIPTTSAARPSSSSTTSKKKLVEFEVEVEEKEVIKSTNFIRPQTPLIDAKGNVLNEDEIPIAPDHIKAPPKEYEEKDITVTKIVKKKLQKLETFDEETPSIPTESSRRNLIGRTTSKPFYDPDAKNKTLNPSSNEKNPSNSSFFRKLSDIFTIKSSREELSRKTIAFASNALTTTAKLSTIVPQKMKEVIAMTDINKRYTIEVIGSEHCIFSLMLQTHLYRQLLVLKGIELDVGKGARIKSLFKSYDNDENNKQIKYKLRKIYSQLQNYCEKLSPCPWSLQELTESCTENDIRRIFQKTTTHIRISNTLYTEEKIILMKLSKLDPFLSIVLTVPSYSRLLAEDSTPNELKLDETNLLLSNNVSKEPLTELIEVEYRARRQAKFGRKNNETVMSTAPPAPIINPENFTPLGLPSGADIGVNGQTKREGRRLWAAYLDSTMKGIESFLTDHLPRNEAILQWHLMTSSLTSLGSNNYPLHCTLIWKDIIQDVPPYVPTGYGQHSTETLSQRAILAAKQFADKRKEFGNTKTVSITDYFTIQEVEKVFMESCRSDVDLAQVNYSLTNFLESLHSRPAPIRSSKLNSALTLLSDCFALTELLSKLPAHIDTLVFCTPSTLSIVPWSLLLIEDRKPPEPGQDPFDRHREQALNVDVVPEDTPPPPLIHVMDKYVVRLGSSLPMIEMNSTRATALSQSPGMHKLCYIDGDDQAILPLTEVETLCVANLWSGDHWDFNVMQGIWASADAVSTKLSEKSLEEQSKLAYEKKIMKEKLKTQRMKSKLAKKSKFKRQEENEDSEEDDEEKGEEEEAEEESTDEEEDEEDESHEDKHTKYRNSKSIANCRVLHLSAIWDTDTTNSVGMGMKSTPAIALPDALVKESRGNPQKKSPIPQQKKRFDAKTIVSQLYLKNCALVTLSRIGMLDNIQSRNLLLSASDGGMIKDSAWDIIDAFHLAGAATVLFPLWGGGSMGGDVGQFARIFLFLRFYYELPNYAHYPRPVAKALQVAQKWLRETTIHDIDAFLEVAPFPLKCVNQLKSDMVAFEKSSIRKNVTSESFQTMKIFNHFFYWGMLTVSGDCRHVHPRNIGEEDEQEKKKMSAPKPIIATSILNDLKQGDGVAQQHQLDGVIKEQSQEDDEDDEVNDLLKEMEWLKLEGNRNEAAIVEEKINKIRLERLKKIRSQIHQATDMASQRLSQVRPKTPIQQQDQHEEDPTVMKVIEENPGEDQDVPKEKLVVGHDDHAAELAHIEEKHLQKQKDTSSVCMIM